MTLADFEHRLSAVEAEVTRLKQGRRSPRAKAHPVETLDAIHGTFAGDDAFREAMRLGRKWRDSQNGRVRRAKARARAR
jgi:hypothetical protein